jgi:hypothetical protein
VIILDVVYRPERSKRPAERVGASEGCVVIEKLAFGCRRQELKRNKEGNDKERARIFVHISKVAIKSD